MSEQAAHFAGSYPGDPYAKINDKTRLEYNPLAFAARCRLLEEMGAPKAPPLCSWEELKEHQRQFDAWKVESGFAAAFSAELKAIRDSLGIKGAHDG